MAEASAAGMSEKSARDWAMFLHLSALSGLVIPFGNLLGPLILWVMKKEESPFVDRHGKAAVNFHISLLIYVVVALMVFVVFGLATIGIGFLLLLPFIILGAIALFVLEVIFPILAGLKAQNGEDYQYPLTIHFLK